jgi:hypothetical protein
MSKKVKSKAQDSDSQQLDEAQIPETIKKPRKDKDEDSDSDSAAKTGVMSISKQDILVLVNKLAEKLDSFESVAEKLNRFLENANRKAPEPPKQPKIKHVAAVVQLKILSEIEQLDENLIAWRSLIDSNPDVQNPMELPIIKSDASIVEKTSKSPQVTNSPFHKLEYYKGKDDAYGLFDLILKLDNTFKALSTPSVDKARILYIALYGSGRQGQVFAEWLQNNCNIASDSWSKAVIIIMSQTSHLNLYNEWGQELKELEQLGLSISELALKVINLNCFKLKNAQNDKSTLAALLQAVNQPIKKSYKDALNKEAQQREHAGNKTPIPDKTFSQLVALLKTHERTVLEEKQHNNGNSSNSNSNNSNYGGSSYNKGGNGNGNDYRRFAEDRQRENNHRGGGNTFPNKRSNGYPYSSLLTHTITDRKKVLDTDWIAHINPERAGRMSRILEDINASDLEKIFKKPEKTDVLVCNHLNIFNKEKNSNIYSAYLNAEDEGGVKAEERLVAVRAPTFNRSWEYKGEPNTMAEAGKYRGEPNTMARVNKTPVHNNTKIKSQFNELKTEGILNDNMNNRTLAPMEIHRANSSRLCKAWGAVDSLADISVVTRKFLDREIPNFTKIASKRIIQLGIKSAGEFKSSGAVKLTFDWGTKLGVSHIFEILELHEPHEIIIGNDLFHKLGIGFVNIPLKFPSDLTPQKPDIPTLREDGVHFSRVSSPVVTQELIDERKKLLEMLDPLLKTNQEQNNHGSGKKGFCNSVLVDLKITEPKAECFKKQYRLPLIYEDRIDEQVDKWLKGGKIRIASSTKFNSPMTVGTKRNIYGEKQGFRLCINPQGINKILEKDSFQIPDIRILLSFLAGMLFFCELDLEGAFLQFLLSEASQEFTAFTMKNQQYFFVGAPFGLKPLSSFYQRAMTKILEGIPGVIIFIDNIGIASKTLEEHISSIKAVVERLNAHNLKLNLKKCQWIETQIKFLGHIADKWGTRIDPEKTESAKNFPKPKNSKEIQRFIGFTGFLRTYVLDYAEIAFPLTSIMTDNRDYIWGPEQERAFQQLKQAIINAPLLHYPKLNETFSVSTDASDHGVSAVLFQDNASKRPDATNIISYASRTLRPYEKNFNTSKKETLAIIYAISHFHDFLFGREFILYCDNKALQYLFNNELSHRVLNEWLQILNTYDFKVVHIPGKENGIADALSRIPEQESTSLIKAHNPPPFLFNQLLIQNSSGIMQGRDANLSSDELELTQSMLLFAKALTGILQDDEEESLLQNAWSNNETVVSLMAMSHKTNASQFSAHVTLPDTNATIGQKAYSGVKKIQLIQEAHLKQAHAGRDSTTNTLVLEGHSWPRMHAEVLKVIHTCTQCLRYNKTIAMHHPMVALVTEQPFDQVQFDLISSLGESTEGYLYVLVCVCLFSSYIILRPMKDKSAKMTANTLFAIFSDYGFPKVFQSDNGGEFSNKVLKELLDTLHIQQNLSTPYYPSSNGKVERSIQTICSAIFKLVQGHGKNWPAYLPFAQLAINTRVTPLVPGTTPFKLMFTRSHNQLQDYRKLETENRISDYDAWYAKQRIILEKINPAVMYVQAADKQRRNFFCDKGNYIVKPLNIGDRVNIINHNKTKKSEPTYIGPFIVKSVTDGKYNLTDVTKLETVVAHNVPISHMKLEYSAGDTSITHIDKDDLYHMECILDSRGRIGKMEYLIKWQDYADSYNSWEPQENILNNELIHNFENEKLILEKEKKKSLDLKKSESEKMTLEKNKKKRK